ncbi:MAG: hypothetical protein OXC10_17140 [Rhodospirillaceae bacterium]|nr:hypothetical protein [Rhodospirillaceae bacterium]
MNDAELEDDGESFAVLRALPVSDKKALFAACLARTVKPQLGPDLKGGTLSIGVTYRGDRSLNPLAIRLAGFFEHIAISVAWDRRRRLA